MKKKTKNKYYDFDALDTAFKFKRDTDGDLIELEYEAGQTSEEIRFADSERRIVTMIDSDSHDGVDFVCGVSIVNRIAHYETEIPLPESIYKSRLIVSGE